MSSYDIEREKQKSEEIRKVFRDMFPLAGEHDLPWAACHIPEFLRSRIKDEVERGTSSFINRIARILCEVSPPKTHMEDMARIVVEKAKRADEMATEKACRVYYEDIVYKVCNIVDRFRADGRRTVSGTIENPSDDVQSAVSELMAELEIKLKLSPREAKELAE